MTDNEIIERLKENAEYDCDKCCYYDEWCNGTTSRCNVVIARNALALIRRQQAEIDRLNGYVNSLTELCETKTALLTDANWSLITTRAEVIKEFVKRLKEHSCFYDLSNYHSFRAVDVDDIDDIAKEMLGD